MTAVVIGIGNPHRRDDGVGPAVAEAVGAYRVPVVSCPAEPTAVLDAWEGADLAIIVDATTSLAPGEIRCCDLGDLDGPTAVSTHDLSLAGTYELGQALGRAPANVVVIAVGATDTGHGKGLSPAVAAAVPGAVAAVLAALGEVATEPRG